MQPDVCCSEAPIMRSAIWHMQLKLAGRRISPTPLCGLSVAAAQVPAANLRHSAHWCGMLIGQQPAERLLCRFAVVWMLQHACNRIQAQKNANTLPLSGCDMFFLRHACISLLFTRSLQIAVSQLRTARSQTATQAHELQTMIRASRTGMSSS